MLRRLWLNLTDRRARAVRQALAGAGASLGDHAADPASAPAGLRPLRAALAAASAASPGTLSSAALAAAEDFTARLEKSFSDMARLSAPPDRAVLEALRCLQLACGAAAGVGGSSGAEALAAARNFSAAGRRLLAQARAAAASDGRDFPSNLKFSTIYSGLDGVFDALERCAEALFRFYNLEKP